MPLTPRPDDWWRDVAYREVLRRRSDPDYWLARLERDRALYEASGGWSWGDSEFARADVKYKREQTERARGPFEELVGTSAVLFHRRKLRKAVTAFTTAVIAEIREYESKIRDSLLGPGGNPEDEREMQRLLERYEYDQKRDQERRMCPTCDAYVRPDATVCPDCGEELVP